MTVYTETQPAPASGPTAAPVVHRMRAVLRIHIANPWQTLILPWIITLLIFGGNAAIWGMITYSAGGSDNVETSAFQSNGGITWIYVYMLIVAVQAMHFTFRFALGFSVTRRDYYAGTLLYFITLAAYYTVGLTALVLLERATDGWWLGGSFFAPLGLTTAPVASVAYTSFAAMLLAFGVGAASAAVWVRWGAPGLYWMFGILTVVGIVALWGATVLEAWPTVWEFLSTTSVVALVSWTLPVTALAALAGYVLLRRSPVRS
ncbi:hypothetical protein [Demequina sp. NBRC 110052]|uniref:hypothetical protein n=1 Tax=Demequina sp. NBRC 110052 TaxID=1570341 RepID=UPI000A04A9EF|nr:hypothetical protein [Demequina sp. NBRC 110052]